MSTPLVLGVSFMKISSTCIPIIVFPVSTNGPGDSLSKGSKYIQHPPIYNLSCKNHLSGEFPIKGQYIAVVSTKNDGKTGRGGPVHFEGGVDDVITGQDGGSGQLITPIPRQMELENKSCKNV